MDTMILNTMWVLVASVFVFLMHAGFAMVEVGFTQSKNAVNIIMKNFVTVSIGVLGYYLVGYGMMYGMDLGGLIGMELGSLMQRYFGFTGGTLITVR